MQFNSDAKVEEKDEPMVAIVTAPHPPPRTMLLGKADGACLHISVIVPWHSFMFSEAYYIQKFRPYLDKVHRMLQTKLDGGVVMNIYRVAYTKPVNKFMFNRGKLMNTMYLHLVRANAAALRTDLYVFHDPCLQLHSNDPDDFAALYARQNCSFGCLNRRYLRTDCNAKVAAVASGGALPGLGDTHTTKRDFGGIFVLNSRTMDRLDGFCNTLLWGDGREKVEMLRRMYESATVPPLSPPGGILVNHREECVDACAAQLISTAELAAAEWLWGKLTQKDAVRQITDSGLKEMSKCYAITCPPSMDDEAAERGVSSRYGVHGHMEKTAIKNGVLYQRLSRKDATMKLTELEAMSKRHILYFPCDMSLPESEGGHALFTSSLDAGRKAAQDVATSAAKPVTPVSA